MRQGSQIHKTKNMEHTKTRLRSISTPPEKKGGVSNLYNQQLGLHLRKTGGVSILRLSDRYSNGT